MLASPSVDKKNRLEAATCILEALPYRARAHTCASMDPQNPSPFSPSPLQNEPQKSKALYYVIGAIILVIIVGWIGSSIAGYIMRKGIETAIQASTGVKTTINSDGTGTYSNSQGSLTVSKNTMPASWPSDAPGQYPGSTISFAGAANQSAGKAEAEVSMNTNDSSDTVVSYYKNALAADGWTIVQSGVYGPQNVIAAKKGASQMEIEAVAAGQQTTITLVLGN